ncbi:MAG: tRNA (adenosine(37)-N6)-dimethylallyltransferase MiaA [Bacteroidales bacterium]|nr:tRNA (adenosine(37)-N6)-dimethylallyltransferase MiaA [Bacteroidales bacterium]
MDKKWLVVLEGPTAVGKSDMAVTLANYFRTSIINADSRQIYREMKIGTATPSVSQLSAVKHHFVGHCSVHDYYNASMFETDAIQLLADLFHRKNTVIMAGGSGMYIDAVCRGIDDIPTVSPEIRTRIRHDYQETGLEGIREKLKQADPEYYASVDLNNPQRILKALEIKEMTGRSYSSFLTGKAKERPFNILKIGLDLPRDELHQRINTRVDKMVEDGLVEEARTLFACRSLNALNTVGYKEIFDYFEGKCTLGEAVENIKAHSRQYARRQLTWFRKDPMVKWFHPTACEEIISFITNSTGGARDNIF